MRSRSGWAAAAGWAGLAIGGQAAALTLIVAGQSVGYQHYVPWSELPSRPLAAGVLVFQCLALAWGLWRDPLPVRAAVSRVLPGWRFLLFVAAMFVSSATVGRVLPRYAGELVLSSFVQLLGLATVAFAVRAIPVAGIAALESWFGSLFGPDAPIPGEDARPTLDRFAIRLALAVVVVCALLAVVVYARHPHLQDEVAYLFQARTFATGRLALPLPPVPRAFSLYLIDAGPNGWYSPVPPGWALVLAIGVPFGLAWMINPLLSGVNILLAYLVLQPLYGRRVARLAVVLLAVSPWQLFLGMSLMPHPVTLFCGLAATYAVMTARRTGQARWTWLGGAALGLLASIRQLDAMIAAAALGLWALGLGGRRLRVPATLGLVLGSILVASPLLLYNRHFTGHASTFPIMAYNDALYGKGANDYGFGKNRGMGWALDPNPGHDPIDGMINADLNLTATQVELFGWVGGSLVLVLALVLAGRLKRSDRLMIGVILITFAAYFLNYFAGGPDFGARYWFLMIVPGAALTARGALTLGERLTGTTDGGTRLLAGVSWLVIAASVTFIPWRSADKYLHYRGMRADIRELARPGTFAGGVVIVIGREMPDYASAAVNNPLELRGDAPIYAWHRDGATDSALVRAFPDRRFWVVDGPTVSGAGYVVRAGPVGGPEVLRLLAAEPARP